LEAVPGSAGKIPERGRGDLFELLQIRHRG
jgi:hypothetical protein